jgi:hypothetical protein
MGGRIAILLVLVLGCSIGRAEEAVEIPLSEVWGLNFLETKPMAELERELSVRPLSYEERSKRRINSMTYQIHRALKDVPRTEMLRGFAVHGEGRESLESVHTILVKGKCRG